MHYIRTGMFSVKTPQGTPLTLITSSIAIKQQWLILDHWACPLNNSPKDSGGVEKTTGWKKQNKIIKRLYSPFLWMGFHSFKARVTLRRQFTLTLSFQKFLVLILWTSKEWKAESTLEPPNSFEHETSALGIQHFNH